MHGHPAYIGVAVHYVRSKQVAYVREALQGAIRDVINTDELDLEVDPSTVSVPRSPFFFIAQTVGTRFIVPELNWRR